MRYAKPSPRQYPDPFEYYGIAKWLEVQLMHKFKQHTVGLPFSDIKRIELAIPEDIVIKQERSVIGRAVIGGLLLGPVGAIVGGMSGLKDGTKTESGDALLTLQVEQAGMEELFCRFRSQEASGQQHMSSYISTYHS